MQALGCGCSAPERCINPDIPTRIECSTRVTDRSRRMGYYWVKPVLRHGGGMTSQTLKTIEIPTIGG